MEAVNTTVVNLQSHACLGARLAQRAVQWRASESARSNTQKTSFFVAPVLSVSPLENTRRNAHCYRRRRFLCSWFNMSHILVQLWNRQFLFGCDSALDSRSSECYFQSSQAHNWSVIVPVLYVIQERCALSTHESQRKGIRVRKVSHK